MKKTLILLVYICLSNASTEIDELKQENMMLKSRIMALEEMQNKPYDDVFIDFNRVQKEHEKAIKEIDSLMQEQFKNNTQNIISKRGFHKANRSFTSFFQSGDISSSMSQRMEISNGEKVIKNDFKVYNNKTEQILTLNDIVKDCTALNIFLSDSFDLKSEEVKIDNFYINEYGFLFYFENIEPIDVSYDDMKPYLKDDFIKALGM